MSMQDDFDAFIATGSPLYIGGEWRAAKSGATMEVTDPATGEIFAQVASGDAADIDDAVAAARAAFENPEWRDMSVAARRKLMLDLADAFEADFELLALIESRNTGMPIKNAKLFDLGLALESLRYGAGWVGRMNGETLSSTNGHEHIYTTYEPVGVVGGIVPWNVPAAMCTEVVAMTLATGCTLVLKAAEMTPLSAVRLGQLCEQVGVPKGVINIVNGGGETGAAMSSHPGIDKIAFTGSTNTGKAIMKSGADTMKRMTLELGGKSPFIIMPDADVEAATQAAANAVFTNTGQICAAGSRLFVHASLYEEVLAGLARIADGLTLGTGDDEAADIGPVISGEQRDKIMDYVDSAVADGARLVAGGKVLDGPGFYMRPTVLADTRPDMRAVKEEIFGPVICARSFDDPALDAVADIANATEFGLSSYIWTGDVATAHLLARKLKAGQVIVNGGAFLDEQVPTGGYKQSGSGRQHGKVGFEAFLELKSVTVNLGLREAA